MDSDDLSDLGDPKLQVNFDANNPEYVDMAFAALETAERAINAYAAFPQPSETDSVRARIPMPGVAPRTPKRSIKNYSSVKNLQDALNKTDQMFREVIVTVMCYRPELGTTLQKVRSTYSRLFQQLQEKMDKVGLKREQECQIAVENCKKLVTEYVNQTNLFKGKLEKYKRKVQNAAPILRMYSMQLAAEQRDSIQLREILKMDAGSANAILQDLQGGKDDDIPEGKLHEVGQSDADTVKGIAGDTTLQQSLEKLQKVVVDMETEENKKELLLSDMKDMIVNMVQATVRESKECQVGEGELRWNLNPGAIELGRGSSEPQSFYANIKDFQSLEGLQVRPKGEDKWNMTPTLVHFLANALKQAERPWPYKHFKNVHLEICRNRLDNTSEIMGCMQPNVPLDQYLCMYFMHKHQLRRLAELKLMEFLTSLKYYGTKWERASLFCKVTGITGNLLDNEEYVYSDYNTQIYYLYALQQLYADPTATWDSPEGQTWIKNDRAKDVTMDLLLWIKRSDPKKIKQKLTPLEIKLTDPSGTTDFFIDLDKLMSIYINEFVEQRKKIRVKIGKEFIKRNQIQQGLFTHTEFAQTVRKNWIGSEEEKMIFPGDFSMSRAFYVAHSMGNNSFEITQESLLTSVVMFGLDSPFPFAVGNLDYLVPLLGDKVDAEANRLRKEKTAKEAAERGVTDRSNSFIKASLRKTTKQGTEGGGMNQQGPSLERVASLLSQHYAILREIKGYADQFRELTRQGTDTEKMLSAFERLAIILTNACEFFNFPVVF